MRIQHDVNKFVLTLHNGNGNGSENNSNCTKIKFYVEVNKAKVMFNLAQSHHQHFNQIALKLAASSGSGSGSGVKPVGGSGEDFVQYKEPQRAMRSLKSRFLTRNRTSSPSQFYTNPRALKRNNSGKTPSGSGLGLNPRASLRRSTTVAPSIMKDKSSDGASSSNNKGDTKYLVKRLAHYSSMADALIHSKSSSTKKSDTDKKKFNVSDKENATPDQNYRYKVYLEPEEDSNPISSQASRPPRPPLAERPILAEILPSRRSVSTNPSARRRSEGAPLARVPVTNSALSSIATPGLQRKIPTATSENINSVMRMGTKVSAHALYREKLRLTSEQLAQTVNHQPLAKKRSLDLDFDTMETKSLLPIVNNCNTYANSNVRNAVVLHTSINEAVEAVPYSDPGSDSLSESLLERFDAMETENTEPEREIVPVTVVKGQDGRLGLKITGTSHGIYVEDFDSSVVIIKDGNFKKGDRIVAVNNRSLENVSYPQALELIRKSGASVHFLVSQIKTWTTRNPRFYVISLFLTIF